MRGPRHSLIICLLLNAKRPTDEQRILTYGEGGERGMAIATNTYRGNWKGEDPLIKTIIMWVLNLFSIRKCICREGKNLWNRDKIKSQILRDLFGFLGQGCRHGNRGERGKTKRKCISLLFSRPSFKVFLVESISSLPDSYPTR